MDKSMGGKNLLTPEKAATFIPVFISLVISIIVIVFFVIPQYAKSNKVNLELNALIKKKNDLNDLKTEYKIINEKFDFVRVATASALSSIGMFWFLERVV